MNGLFYKLNEGSQCEDDDQAEFVAVKAALQISCDG